MFLLCLCSCPFSWGFFFQCWITPGVPVRMQQLSSSTISFVEVFLWFLTSFLLLLFHTFLKSQAEAISGPLSSRNSQKSASGFRLCPLCTNITEMARNTIPVFSLGGTVPADTLGDLRVQAGKEHPKEPQLFSQNLFSF